MNEHTIILVVTILIFLYSVILHEIAHGYAALRCGDNTAFMLGRLSLNPIRHIDPIMTIILPAITYFAAGFFFGGAKPVPVNPRNFRSFVRDDIIVSLAGVAVNLMLAVFFAVILHAAFYLVRHNQLDPGSIIFEIAIWGMFLNFLLMLFNLLPIPPLDGSHVFKYLLPPGIRPHYEQIGFFGLIILVFFIQSDLYNTLVSRGFGTFLDITFFPIEDRISIILTLIRKG
ncbi:MAG: site-2 protease family protein [Candidatus Brocadiia bacterium]